jgi:hypothetical protein
MGSILSIAATNVNKKIVLFFCGVQCCVTRVVLIYFQYLIVSRIGLSFPLDF